ncbi:MAG: hypothetical protein SFV15_11375 [Polyangiaceae bacterium]|nr:hypothetical protein [Polyangiaceae bacterium]
MSDFITAPPTESKELDLTGNVREFFGSALETALREVDLETSKAAKSYLVALMADFADPRNACDARFDEPFTFALERALSEHTPDRFERLRRFGDSVLYASSFFSEHLARRGVPIGYVKSLGSRAYLSAANALMPAPLLLGSTRSEDSTGTDTLFVELADKFGSFVVILERVAERVLSANTPSNKATLDLYERWLRTGSSVLAEDLMRRGLSPLRGDRSIH